MKQYTKAILGGLALIFNALHVSYSDNVFDMDEQTHFVTTLITIGLGVYAIYKGENVEQEEQ